MNKNDTLNLAFSLYLMYNDPKYNAKLYDYKVPKQFSRKKEIFETQNGYELFELQQYNRNNTLVRLIYNYWIANNKVIKKVSQDDYTEFVESLTQYQNKFNLFVNRNLNDLTPQTLYQMYVKKEIPFYIFYYTFKYVKFKDSFMGSVLIKNKIKQVKQLLLIFTHFDEDWIKEELKRVQKIVIFNNN